MVVKFNFRDNTKTKRVDLEELPRFGDLIMHPIFPMKAFYKVEEVLIVYDKMGKILWREIYLNIDN